MNLRRTITAFSAGLALVAGAAVMPSASAEPAETAPLTNLAHLDWLGAKVTPPAQSGHTTYQLK